MGIVDITNKGQVPDGDQFKGRGTTESFNVSLGEDGLKSKAVDKVNMPSNDGSYFGGPFLTNDRGSFNPSLPAEKKSFQTFVNAIGAGAGVQTHTYDGLYNLLPIDINSLDVSFRPLGHIINKIFFDGVSAGDSASFIISAILRAIDGLVLSDSFRKILGSLAPVGQQGSLFSWGKNTAGESGTGSPGGFMVATPKEISNRGDLSSLALIDGDGDNFAFVDGVGGAFILGKNTNGQMGDGTTTSRTLPSFLGTGWKKITFGQTHALGIKQDGTLWAWGDNTYGQLGQGDVVARTTPTQIGTSAFWTDIACAYFDSCAIDSGGGMWRWGRNDFGQIGDGSVSQRNSPVDLSGGPSFVAVEGGDAVFLAQDTTGAIWGSGKNSLGQIGDNLLGTDSHGFSQSILPLTITKFKLQGAAAAAIDNAGNLYTWGSNSNGVLGDGSFISNGLPVINLTSVKDVAISSTSCNALKTDGTRWFTGDNTNGTRGDGTSGGGPTNTFTQVGTKNTWVEIFASQWSFMGIDSLPIVKGSLFAWGDNTGGRLGNGLSAGSTLSIKIIDSGNNVTKYRNNNNSQFNTTLIIKDDNFVYGTGTNANGSLGDGTVASRNTFAKSGISQWRNIVANDGRSFFLGTDNQVYGAGDSGSGALSAFGDGITVNHNYVFPTLITASPLLKDVVKISTGQTCSCFINSEGKLFTVGRGISGALANGGTANTSIFSQVPDTVPKKYWIDCAYTMNQTIYVLASDNTLWGAGNNTFGELGQGDNAQRNSLVQIDSNVKIFNVGQSHINYIKNDGTLWSVGWNARGQCLDGTTTNRNIPVQETLGITDWDYISGTDSAIFAVTKSGRVYVGGWNIVGELSLPVAAGGTFTTLQRNPQLENTDILFGNANAGFGIQKLRQVKTWGSNTYGQLLTGDTVAKSTPFLGDANNIWAQISSQYNNTILLKNDGTIWGVGDNRHGELGLNNTISPQLTLVQESTLATDWVRVQAGNWTTEYLKSNGDLYISGQGGNGQLGLGGVTSALVPTKITTLSNIILVDSGGNHSLAIDINGGLWFWGFFESTRGDGISGDVSTPLDVSSGGVWIDVSCGGAHNLAIRNNGTLWVSGANTSGQLGDGTLITNNIRQQIGVNVWSKISGGNNHSGAIDRSGKLWMWGGNANGQVGNGVTGGNVTTPTQIGTDTDWIDIVCSTQFTFAKKSDGTVWAWGKNTANELGDFAGVSKNVPTLTNYTYRQLSTGSAHVGILS